MMRWIVVLPLLLAASFAPSGASASGGRDGWKEYRKEEKEYYKERRKRAEKYYKELYKERARRGYRGRGYGYGGYDD